MNRAALIEQLKKDEGFRGKPYRCTAGKLTIGFGRNLDDVGISVGEAEFLLYQDVADVEQALNEIPGYAALDDVRQTVLANMAFNLGLTRLLKFKKMRAALRAGDFNTAATEMLDSLWARQVGTRADRLARQMRTGEL